MPVMPVPDDPRWHPLTKDQRTVWLRDKVTSAWPQAQFRCNRCFSRCYEHPATKHIIGCLVCGRSSAAIFTQFHTPYCTFCSCYCHKHKPVPGTDPQLHQCAGCGGVHAMVAR